MFNKMNLSEQVENTNENNNNNNNNITLQFIEPDIDYNYLKIKYDHEFIHFDTEKKCFQFIEYVKKSRPDIKIGDFCCRNKGCSLLNISNAQINIIKHKFNSEHINSKLD